MHNFSLRPLLLPAGDWTISKDATLSALLTTSSNLESSSINPVTDFFRAAVHSAIDSPCKGVQQIASRAAGFELPCIQLVEEPKAADFGSLNWHAQQFGSAVGMLVPFTIVAGGVKGISRLGASFFQREVTSLGVQLAATSSRERICVPLMHAATSGFVFDFALRPVAREENGEFWTARLRNGACGAITFATLTGGTIALQELSKARLAATPWMVHSTGRDLGRHVLTGFGAGAIDAQTRSVLSGKGMAGLEETFQSAYGFSIVGAGLRGKQEAIAKVRSEKTLAQVVAENVKLQETVLEKPDASKLILDHGNTRVRPGDIRDVGRLLNGDLDAINRDFYYDENRSKLGRYYDRLCLEARWKMRDACTEARRMTYAFLNKFNLRHPFQRLGDVIFGAEANDASHKPALTVENNPVAAFDRELTTFFEKIKEKEDLLSETTERKQQHAIQDQQSAIRAEFAFRLLTLWHGTSDQPGIASHTDLELSRSLGVSAERVAQIRKVFDADGRNSSYRQPSDLTKALFDLLPGAKPEYSEAYDIAREVAGARERFFNYDETALAAKMSMPPILYFMDHHFSTPLTWMPFDATPQLANLFHGTVSNALPSILAERAMLPAVELRLRGIAQTTGECATEKNPRRAISITRDFNEAWCYHRHSPLYLSSFPVIVGISGEVSARARLAGFAEPGEILIDKLNLGSSVLTKIGLKSKDITHLYVPDGQVAVMANKLAARRVRGVSVVGFNELKTPEWNVPDPESGGTVRYGF